MDGRQNRAATPRTAQEKRLGTLAERHCAERLAALRDRGALLPVCSWCRRIRDETGRWTRPSCGDPEAAGVVITHGLCPDCRRRHFPRQPQAA